MARDWGQWRRWMRRPGGDDDDDGEERVAVLQRRAWRYWLERTVAALGHGPPTGLYDAAVRARFKTFMEDRSEDFWEKLRKRKLDELSARVRELEV